MRPPRRRKVDWAEPAADDLERIYTYLSARSPAVAVQVIDRLEAAAHSLEDLALRGRQVPELAEAGAAGYREIIEAPYRIVYRPTADRVLVLAVLDGRRDLESVLLARLLGIP